MDINLRLLFFKYFFHRFSCATGVCFIKLTNYLQNNQAYRPTDQLTRA